MEVAAEAEQSLIFKGKRTKRQRLLSPIPFSIVLPSSSSQEHDVEEEPNSLVSKENRLNNEINNKDNKILINGVASSSSASSSSNNNAAADQEDQDMANCLILLAQGHFLPNQNRNYQQQQTRQLMISCQESGYNNNNNTQRSSSRRFLETKIGGGRAGYYVYQCKTCDRTFPSFQALGGHRASHKKPKSAAHFHSDLDLKKTIYDDGNVPLHLNNVSTTRTPNNHRSLPVYGKSSNNKVHECGICGAEFASGQALGGHMRRHRGAVVAVAARPAAANTALSLSFDQMSDGQVHAPVKRARSEVVSLDLDLNLPAPEDENRVNGLSFALKQEHEQEHKLRQQQKKQREEDQQKSFLLLSSAPPTLVDCFY